MEYRQNPFLFLEQRLSRIEDLIGNLNQTFAKLYIDGIREDREPEFIDAVEVSTIAKVKLNTIYAYNTRGTIPIYSSETPIIYKRDEIIEWLGNGKKLTPRLEKLMEERKLIKK